MVDATPPRTLTFSEKFACPVHGPSLVELEPRIFSFNAPHGACPRCTGLGSQMEIDPDLVVPDPTLSTARARIGAVAGERLPTTTPADPGDRERVRCRSRHAVAGSAADSGSSSLDGTTATIQVPLPQPLRAPALVTRPVRGHRAEPRAALPGDRLGLLAGEDRGVHDAAARARTARALACARSRAPVLVSGLRSTSSGCRRGGR